MAARGRSGRRRRRTGRECDERRRGRKRRDERRRRGREALVAGAGAAGRRERGRSRSPVQQPGADELEGGADGADGEVDGRGEFGQPDGAISSRRPPGLSENWGRMGGSRAVASPGRRRGVLYPPPLVPGRASARD